MDVIKVVGRIMDEPMFVVINLSLVAEDMWHPMQVPAGTPAHEPAGSCCLTWRHGGAIGAGPCAIVEAQAVAAYDGYCVGVQGHRKSAQIVVPN